MNKIKMKNSIKVITMVLAVGIFVALPLVAMAALTPTVLTREPTTIKADAAIIEGQITNDGGDPSGKVWFDYGTSPSFGSRSSTKSFYGRGIFSIRISGLEECTKYYYRSMAENSAGIAFGQGGDFTTYCPISTGSGIILANAGSDNTATQVSTGIGATLFGSVFLPLMLAVLLVWALRSPLVGLDRWAVKRKQVILNWRACRKLAKLRQK